MTFRRFATGAALAIAGLAAAVGIGLLANSISGDSVGLGAEPLSAGETLAPATVKAENRERQRQRRHRNRGGDDRPADTVTVPPSTSGDDGTVTTFDDHGGDRSGSDDNSGPGSTSTGSGSSGSGSSGSGSGSSSHSGGSDDD
jgi:hypothetical protein